MKKILMILLFILIGLYGCSKKENFENLEILNSNFTIGVDEVIYLDTNSEKLNVEIINWESENDLVATVDNGVVTGIGAGAVYITATSGDYSAKVRVIVEDRLTSKINITGKQSLLMEDTLSLNLFYHDSIEYSDIKWSSSDDSIATVDNGKVTGLKPGIVTIKAMLNSNNSIYDEYIIYVYKNETISDQIINTINRQTFELTGNFDLTALNSQITASINSIGNAFVGVSNYVKVGANYNLQSNGSGIIYHRLENETNYTYRLITNYHVIEGNDQIKVYLGYLDLEIIGTVIKSNQELDLAIVEFSDKLLIEPVVFATDELQIADFVLAIGNPNGYEYFGSVTFGIVSHTNRYFPVEGGDGENKYIQHDAAINSGNSGGPLLNVNGELIGINTLKLVNLSIEGMGFAIPLDVIIEIIRGV